MGFVNKIAKLYLLKKAFEEPKKMYACGLYCCFSIYMCVQFLNVEF